MQEIDKEKLRAFEQKMHDEGADGFADGPRPWETWDESGSQAGDSRHVWEGKARRIYKNAPVRRSLGDRVISGLAMIALATMAVGIAGVYLTDDQPPAVAWTAIQPTPIPLPGQRAAADTQRLPARTQRPAPVIAEFDSLPPPAAGIQAVALDIPPAETPASGMMPPPATDSGPAAAATPHLAAPAAAAPAENTAGDTAASDPDIEIVKSPAALLLTSTGTGSPDDSYEASDVAMDPELAMEIATAPAAAGSMEAVPVAASGMLNRETGTVTAHGSTGTDGINRKAAPAMDLINRGGSSPAGVGGTLPEAATATTGTETEPASETVMEPAAIGTTAALPVIAPPDTAAEEDTAAAEDAGNKTLAINDTLSEENPPPATMKPATDSAETSDTAAPAESGMQAQDMTPPAGENPAAGENTVVALAEPKPAAAAPAGDWVVNLATYNHEAMARKMLGVFQAKGVTAEIESTVINDRTMYRIRVPGFENSRAARASIANLEQTLGLKGVWISKR